ncbi:hypothetical protein [Streptomyces sp. NPDC088785]|uniref:hypothetical protein n=1 Tax=Streptomyces sp. NPDC088785 TaxID=3365897 RepID=UPI00382FD593
MTASADPSRTPTRTRPAPHLDLGTDPDEIGHLVCCRDASWRTAFCGEEQDSVRLDATTVCTLCVEAVTALRPGFRFDPEQICPVDDRRCPDLHEVALRVARETGPPTR